MFIDGYLGLLTAIGSGAVTECAQPNYNRQSIAFGAPVDGVTFSAVPFTFGQGLVANATGRAIYDAPIGGNLLLVLPLTVPGPKGGRMSWDAGDVGHLRLFLTALQSTHRGEAYTGRIAAGAMAGLCSDLFDVVTNHDITQVMGQERSLINTATMTAGVALSLARGVLQAAALVPAGSE